MNFHVGWAFSSGATIFTDPHHDVAAAVIEAGLFPQSILPYVSILRTEAIFRSVLVIFLGMGDRRRQYGYVM